MTAYQTAICKTNFLLSMQNSGHGDVLEETKHGVFLNPETQFRWLGFKRCWEDHVRALRDERFAVDTATQMSSEVECVFVGGPLHGMHQQDMTKELRILEHEGKEYLYSRMSVEDDTPNRVVYVLMNRSPQTAG